MRAVVLTGTGGPEVLQVQERPDPPVGPGEVRIAVKAAGINFADTMARVGLYPDAPKPPCVLGYEVAGEVESVGEGVSEHAVGDRVVAGTRFGGQAELVTRRRRARRCRLPDRLSFEQGAAFPVNYGTAYAALILMGGMREGDRVLIHAAAGGVGISATQIARNAGAEIFGTASRLQARRDPRPGRRPRDRLPQPGLRGRGDADHRRRGSRPDHRRARPDLASARTTGCCAPAGGWSCTGSRRASKAGTRDIPATLKSLAKMPLATMPVVEEPADDEREQRASSGSTC